MSSHKCKNSNGQCSGCGKCKKPVLSKSRKEEIPGGLADGKDPKDFDAEQLAIGAGIEMEHTESPKIAMEIAMDHLTESKDYYKKLIEFVEPELKSIQLHLVKNRPVVRKIDFQGLPVSIEADKGEMLEWHDNYEGRSGKTKMRYPYGFIRHTDGKDGEEVDVYVGPSKDSEKVFVCHQVKGKKFEIPDEDKVMLGFDSAREAKAAFLVHYDDERYLHGMTESTMSEFKKKFMNKSLNAGMPMTPNPMMPNPMMGMNPQMGMMPMGPPPTDVESFEGCQILLDRMGSVKDLELMSIAEKIWGNGYNFTGISPEQARQEIIGFLMDQRDLLGVEPPPNEYELSGESQGQSDLGLDPPSLASQSLASANDAESQEANSPEEDSNLSLLPPSSPQDSSQNPPDQESTFTS